MAEARRAPETILVAKILRYCRFCSRETAHEVRTGSFGPRAVCLRCQERALLEELDRD